MNMLYCCSSTVVKNVRPVGATLGSHPSLSITGSCGVWHSALMESIRTVRTCVC